MLSTRKEYDETQILMESNWAKTDKIVKMRLIVLPSKSDENKVSFHWKKFINGFYAGISCRKRQIEEKYFAEMLIKKLNLQNLNETLFTNLTFANSPRDRKLKHLCEIEPTSSIDPKPLIHSPYVIL